jgi:hypothetical protein
MPGMLGDKSPQEGGAAGRRNVCAVAMTAKKQS